MYIGGLDVGTTGCKIAVYDENGTLYKNYYYEYNIIYENGQHEIDFRDVKSGVLTILKEAAHECHLEALGITSFGETFCLLDENDEILSPSMLYTDPRGEKQCNQLCSKMGEDKLTHITGVKPNPMYSIYKIMWLRDNCAEKFARCKKILLGEDFIVYTLTGKAQIDFSLAARTAAFDIGNNCWCDEIFAAAKIDKTLLSQPVPAGTVAGVIKQKIKNLLEIDYDIIIVNGCHDQVAAMIGAGVFNTNQAMDGTGTVECIPVVLSNVPEDKNIYNGGYSVVPFVSGKYACYALSFTGGATLKWFRDSFAELEKKQAEQESKNVYAMLDKKAPENPTGILILPHFAGAATPYMDSSSKAAMVGITLETTKYDIYKALMEGTSYEMLLNFNTLKAFTGNVTEIRATGGGASSDVWLQIKADILNVEILSLDCQEVGAAGTAALAGAAIGCYDDLEKAASTMAKPRKRFMPDRKKQKQYALLYKKYRDLYAVVKDLGKGD